MPGPSTGSGRGASGSPARTGRRGRGRATTTGTLTRNTERQPVPTRSAETSTPPRIWPGHHRRARPWRRTGSSPGRGAAPAVADWMVASTCGSIAADAAPCATRAATSVQAVGASPHASEVTPKAAMPPRNSRRRPNRSPSRPPRTSRTAYATPYPATTSSSTGLARGEVAADRRQGDVDDEEVDEGQRRAEQDREEPEIAQGGRGGGGGGGGGTDEDEDEDGDGDWVSVVRLSVTQARFARPSRRVPESLHPGTRWYLATGSVRRHPGGMTTTAAPETQAHPRAGTGERPPTAPSR